MNFNEWKEYNLDELCLEITDGSHSSPKTVEQGYPMASVKDMEYSKINLETCRKISKEDYEKLVKGKCKPEINDVLIAKDGSYLKYVNVVKEDIDLVLLSSIAILRPDIGKIDPDFFKYYLVNPVISKRLEQGYVSGSVIRRIVLKDFKKFKIKIPDIIVQKRIARILLDLDKKIETNNEINKKLEEIAEAIFKQWFVDFEFPNEDGKPYKSSGGEMVESELGMIPKGWEVILLDEIVDTFNGYSYKGKELSESEDAMITIKNFDRNGGYKMDGLKEIVISDKVKPHHFVEVNDIIVAHTDLTQGAEIIGNPIMIFSKGSYEKLIMSMDTVKVKSKIKEMNNELLYFILKDYRFKQYALGYVNGTTVLHLSKSTIPQYKIALPYDKSIMNQLGDNLSPIMSKIANNFKENEKLIMLRDVLLPKLMSGEIRVPMD